MRNRPVHQVLFRKQRGSALKKKVYKDDTLGRDIFEYFRNLRNKHVAYDENAYSQCILAAIISNPSKDYKVEKIISISAFANILDQVGHSNLCLLVSKALDWVTNRFDALCDELTAELEAEAREALMARKSPTITAPHSKNIARRRASI